MAKRIHVNASLEALEQLVARELTREELEAIAVELCYRKQKPRTLELMARIAELMAEAEAG